MSLVGVAAIVAAEVDVAGAAAVAAGVAIGLATGALALDGGLAVGDAGGGDVRTVPREPLIKRIREVSPSWERGRLGRGEDLTRPSLVIV